MVIDEFFQTFRSAGRSATGSRRPFPSSSDDFPFCQVKFLHLGTKTFKAVGLEGVWMIPKGLNADYHEYRRWEDNLDKM